MEKERKNKRNLIVILLVLLSCMTIVFASFSQNLKVNGMVKFNSLNQWNIAFDDIITLSTTGYATGTKSNDITQKNITFTCEFLAQNDSCEISFDVINKGSIKALLKGFSYEVLSNNTTLYKGNSNYTGDVLSVGITKPNWSVDSTILNPQDKGNFKLKALVNNMSGLTETTKFKINLTFEFEQS